MERIDRIEKAIEELVASQKKTDEQLAKMDAQLVELSESQRPINSNASELATSRKVVQNPNSNSEYADEFFYYSLSQKMQLGGIKFDYIERNIKGRLHNLADKFDIVLYNDDTIGLLEIKNTVKAANVTQLLQTKLQNFRTLNPEYANAKIYLGIGGFTFENESVKASAKAAGIIVLEVQGDHFEADVANMRAF